MYAHLEEDYGLAKRAMNIYERATSAVADADKFEVRLVDHRALLKSMTPYLQMYEIYIAKAAENFGLAATRPIYERALEVLPDRQTAQMCLRFAALERKLGEIDRARAIYAHASQFCDPRVNPDFWSEWNSFEIETGSEDTFREMLRIKRSVQAQFNTEASYLAAQAMATRKGDGDGAAERELDQSDPMARAEREAGAGGKGMTFVPSKQNVNITQTEAPLAPAVNEEEIHISDEDD